MKKILFFLLLATNITAIAQDSSATAPAYFRIPYEAATITIDIPPIIIDGTILQRKARLFDMDYNQNSQFLALRWRVHFYADSAGTYGKSLEKTSPFYSLENVADNSTFVNPTTGQILVADASGSYGMNYMGQYDFFNYVAQNQAVVVHDVLRQYGAMVLNWDKR